MSLLYVNEHITCYNYDSGDNSAVTKRVFEKNSKWHFSTLKNKLIYLPKGKFVFSYGKYKNVAISGGQMMLLPSGVFVTGVIEEDSTIYILRLSSVRSLCECFSLDMLLKEEDESAGENLFKLNVDSRIVSFFELWDVFLSDGLLCRYYLNLKIKELFYYLRAYHTKGDLLAFFYPVLSNDITFSDFVMRNRRKVKTVQELAELANYSLSGFQKRFKKVFNVSAHSWLKEEKLKDIFHDITNTTKTFKEISSSFDFSSPSHFNDYCKTNFGHTPGVLRRKKININI